MCSQEQMGVTSMWLYGVFEVVYARARLQRVQMVRDRL